MRNVVVDPGFLVCLFDESNAGHRRCRAFLRGYQARFLTTQAAVAQTLALLSPAQQLRCLEWLRRAAQAGLLVADSEPLDFPAIENLARNRAGRPMDFAGATLVLLAERTGVNGFLAADRRDFEAYGLGERVQMIELPEEAENP